MSKASLDLQARKINEYRNLKQPFENELSGIRFTVLPNVFPGGADSEVLCENMDIKPGGRVLDLCTGNGIVALYARLHGAGEVIGTDLNPTAIENARLNAKSLKLSQIEFIKTDLFPDTEDKYDLITINPPYTDHPSPDETAICFWDEGNSVIKRFFAQFNRYLTKDGVAYIAWSDFANFEFLEQVASENGCTLVRKGTKSGRSGFAYYCCQVIKQN